MLSAQRHRHVKRIQHRHRNSRPSREQQGSRRALSDAQRAANVNAERVKPRTVTNEATGNAGSERGKERRSGGSVGEHDRGQPQAPQKPQKRAQPPHAAHSRQTNACQQEAFNRPPTLQSRAAPRLPGHFSAQRDRVSGSREHSGTQRDRVSGLRGHSGTQRDRVSGLRGHSGTQRDRVSGLREHSGTQSGSASRCKEAFSAQPDQAAAALDSMPSVHADSSKNTQPCEIGAEKCADRTHKEYQWPPRS